MKGILFQWVITDNFIISSNAVSTETLKKINLIKKKNFLIADNKTQK